MNNVIQLGGVTRLNLSPDRVLKNAIGQFDDDGVVIMGYDKNGDTYFASSIANGGTVLWLLENCKKRLLETKDDL
ncbi:MAG: hypothetical protein GY807_21005 [Gammaproteobacteria bacterium]|nr:hypothetical protein [Gammaproteobacteria bacterium]